MVLLDHYVENFQKWLVILVNLIKIKIKIKQQCILRLKINNLKDYHKIWKKFKD